MLSSDCVNTVRLLDDLAVGIARYRSPRTFREGVDSHKAKRSVTPFLPTHRQEFYKDLIYRPSGLRHQSIDKMYRASAQMIIQVVTETHSYLLPITTSLLYKLRESSS